MIIQDGNEVINNTCYPYTQAQGTYNTTTIEDTIQTLNTLLNNNQLKKFNYNLSVRRLAGLCREFTKIIPNLHDETIYLLSDRSVHDLVRIICELYLPLVSSHSFVCSQNEHYLCIGTPKKAAIFVYNCNGHYLILFGEDSAVNPIILPENIVPMSDISLCSLDTIASITPSILDDIFQYKLLLNEKRNSESSSIIDATNTIISFIANMLATTHEMSNNVLHDNTQNFIENTGDSNEEHLDSPSEF